MDSHTAQVWIAALSTLAVFSFLYRENPVYRWAEHTFVAMAVAHGVVMTWDNWIKPTITKDILKDGKYYLLTAVVVGLFFYARYFKGGAWLTRCAIAMTVGYWGGYMLGYSPAVLVGQLTGSFYKLSLAPSGINNTITFLTLVCTLTYFLFTIRQEKNPVVAIPANIGRWAMMVAFGTAFGNTIMARMSLFLGRLQFLLGDWLHAIK